MAAIQAAPVEWQLGRTVAELVPELWPALEPIYRSVLETGQPVSTKAVKARPVRCWRDPLPAGSYYPVRVADEVIGIGLVVVDVTEPPAGRRPAFGSDAEHR